MEYDGDGGGGGGGAVERINLNFNHRWYNVFYCIKYNAWKEAKKKQMCANLINKTFSPSLLLLHIIIFYVVATRYITYFFLSLPCM